METSVAVDTPQAIKAADAPLSPAKARLATHLRLAAYGAPAFATQFLVSPSWSIIPGIYAKYYGVSLAAVATIFFVTRIVDAVIGPVIGVLSDRHRARGGSRRIWVMAGGAGFVVAGYLLFAPPVAVSPAYLFVVLIAFFILWTMTEVPQFAWGREIGSTLEERAVAFGWKTVFGFAGNAAFFMVPFLALLPTREYSPALMEIAAIVGVSAMAVALCANYFFAPDGTTTKHEPLNMRAVVNLARTNAPLRLVFMIIILDAIMGGIWYGSMYIYLSAVVGDPNDIALTFLGAAFIGLCAIPMWTKVIQSIGPIKGLVACKSLYALALTATLVLSTATSSWVPLVLIAIGFFAVAGANVAYPLLLADAADYGLLKTRVDFGGTSFAGHAFLGKVGYAVGVFVALTTLGIFGFDATAETQTALARIGLPVTFAGLPLILAIPIIVLALQIKLTRHRASVVRQRLSRTQGLA